MSLLEALGIEEPKEKAEEKQFPFEISELMDVIQERTEMNEFPLLDTNYVTGDDEKIVAQQ